MLLELYLDSLKDYLLEKDDGILFHEDIVGRDITKLDFVQADRAF